MSLNKKYKIGIIFLLSLTTLLFIGSLFLTNLVSKKVSKLLTGQNIQNYHISIDKTKFSLFDRSLVLTGILLNPTDSSMALLKKRQLDKNSLHKVSISRLKLRGIELIPLLFSTKINVNYLILDSPEYQKYSNNNKKKSDPLQKSINIDSIHIENIKGFQLNHIKVTNLKVQIIDVEHNKITFENTPLNFKTTGFKLVKIDDAIFKISPIDDIFEIRKIKIVFPEKKYSLSIGAINFNAEENNLSIKKLRYKPLISRVKLANTYRYNSDIFNIAFEEMKIFNFDFLKAVENNGIFIDSIKINQFSLDSYKDKRKPFNTNRRPKLPHNLIKQMKTPLLIHKISLDNSKMVYEERLENKDLLMIATMHEINADILNITNIEPYKKQPLKINLKTKFMGKANLTVNLSMPLEDDQNTFYFSAHLGASEMYYYDSAIIPALGLKILKGRLESLTFQASSNNYTSTGTMKMLYHDLEAEVFKQKGTDKNGFLSWSVNHIVHRSNPGKNGNVRVATMNYDHVPYKGFANVIWKTVQNGIINTIAPFGMTKEKADAKKRRQLKREKKKHQKKSPN